MTVQHLIIELQKLKICKSIYLHIHLYIPTFTYFHRSYIQNYILKLTICLIQNVGMRTNRWFRMNNYWSRVHWISRYWHLPWTCINQYLFSGYDGRFLRYLKIQNKNYVLSRISDEMSLFHKSTSNKR